MGGEPGARNSWGVIKKKTSFLDRKKKKPLLQKKGGRERSVQVRRMIGL